MKLKKLLLQGYKTFASKTEFIFDDGLTAVVGPNGSGKSNVADAVRWVLGEQSYSTLRGKKTTDMIFAGSEKRPRAGMAQATLTLDNSDRWLPLDYTEVEICRRAYRSGENEYLVNGQKVRLMDVADLLTKAGLAEQTYTIIGQGLIDQALSLKADERRALFEEAAGISHYKAKRAATLRKLQETQANLLRVNDILTEIKPRLASLKKQAGRAQTYQQVEKDLLHLLRIWYGYQWEEAKQTMRQRKQEATLMETTWRKTRAELLGYQEQVSHQRQQLHLLQEQLLQKQQAREQVREKAEQLQRQLLVLQERQKVLVSQLAETEGETPLLESQLAAAKSELEYALNELNTAQTEVNEQQAQIQAFENNFQTTQKEITHWRNEVQRLENALRQAQNSVAQAEGQLTQLRERLAEPTSQHPAGGELSDLASQKESLTAALKAAEAEVKIYKEKRQTVLEAVRQLEREQKNHRRHLEELRKEHTQQQTKLARQQAQVEMLARLRYQAVPVGKEVEVVGQLAQFLTIPAAYQRPLEFALQNRLTAVVIPDESHLHKILAQRTAEQNLTLLLQTISAWLPVQPPHPAVNHPQVLGWASEFVTCTDELLAPSVMALLQAILLVQDTPTALELINQLPAGSVAVTSDGLLAHASGLVELVRHDGQNLLFGQEEEFRQAETELNQGQKLYQKQEKLLEEGQETGREQQRELDQMAREERQLFTQEAEAQQVVSKTQRELDRVTQQEGFLRRQQENVQKEREQLQKRLTNLEQQLTTGREQEQSLSQALTSGREKLQSLPIAEAEQQRQALQQQLRASRSLLDGRRAIADSRRATHQQVEEQLRRLKTRREDWSTQLLKMNLSADEAQLTKLQKELEEYAAGLTPLQTEMQALQRQLQQVEGQAAVVQRANHEHETRYMQSKVALSQHETHIENLKERIRAELGIVSLPYDEHQTGETPLPLSGVVNELPPVDELPEGLDDSIMKRRTQLKNMGAINPEAPAEYEALQERHDFLEQQMSDLTTTDEQLRQVIAELDELTSRAFAETVQKVNGVFGGLFTRLFGGGSAELLLTEPDDLTISGVDIVAQLPGRRPQGLALLSGGERSLTAASLIFALLKVSPTPFCMMDEVDAALDEANVARFRDVLVELSQQTQFIVITHNRGTVQAAQTIYGITMGTDSASQVISLKPEEYVQENEMLKG